MKKILIIQTSFIGDVVLALPVAQRLRAEFPAAEIHFLARGGNEGLLQNHPAIDKIWVWEKKSGKYRSLLQLIGKLRRHRFDLAVNLHRFAATGLLMALVSAKEKVGFDKNPLSFLYHRRLPHIIKPDGFPPLHEVDRNLSLIAHLAPVTERERPRLYPSATDYERVAPWVAQKPFVVLAPASVWFTKQWPEEKWAALLRQLPPEYAVYLVGAPTDAELCQRLANPRKGAQNLAGKLGLLASAALMAQAERVFVNDSAPLHFASAMDAPVTAVFCSTVSGFGFTPLSARSVVVETVLPCRPCGLHGSKACPLGHFLCAESVTIESVLATLKN